MVHSRIPQLNAAWGVMLLPLLALPLRAACLESLSRPGWFVYAGGGDGSAVVVSTAWKTNVTYGSGFGSFRDEALSLTHNGRHFRHSVLKLYSDISKDTRPQFASTWDLDASFTKVSGLAGEGVSFRAVGPHGRDGFHIRVVPNSDALTIEIDRVGGDFKRDATFLEVPCESSGQPGGTSITFKSCGYRAVGLNVACENTTTGRRSAKLLRTGDTEPSDCAARLAEACADIGYKASRDGGSVRVYGTGIKVTAEGPVFDKTDF